MLHLQEFLHGHCYSDQTEEDPPFNVALSVSGMAGGGKAFLDHQDNTHRVFSKRLPRSSSFTLEDEDGMDVSEDTGDVEQRQRLEERWKFDMDDAPLFGPESTDEHDRVLVDDYDTKYGFHDL